MRGPRSDPDTWPVDEPDEVTRDPDDEDDTPPPDVEYRATGDEQRVRHD